jgi:hypothetical protein
VDYKERNWRWIDAQASNLSDGVPELFERFDGWKADRKERQRLNREHWKNIEHPVRTVIFYLTLGVILGLYIGQH